MCLVVQLLGSAVGAEDFHAVLPVAIQDGVDRELPGYVLHLAATEVVGRCEIGALGRGEGGEHRMPDLLPDGCVGPIETDLVEEAAFEGRVEILGQVGRGDQDPVQGLHLLQDDVLDAVLHLVDGVFRPIHPLSENGVRLIEEQDRGDFRALNLQPVPVEHGLDVLLGVADPLAFDLRDMDGQDTPSGLPGELVNRFGLPGSRIAIEQAGESAPVTALLHPFPDFLVAIGRQERPELSHLHPIAIGVEEVFLEQGFRFRQPGNGRLVGVEVEIGKEDLPGFRFVSPATGASLEWRWKSERRICRAFAVRCIMEVLAIPSSQMCSMSPLSIR